MISRVVPILIALLLATMPAGAQLHKGKGAGVIAKKARQAKRAQAIERFNEMPPEQQKKVLDNLPPERRQRVERNIERYNHLPPEEKRQIRNFQELPLEKQQAARQIFRRMNELPVDRKVEIRREMARLRNLPDGERKTRLTSAEFRGNYSASERRMIEEMTDLFPAK